MHTAAAGAARLDHVSTHLHALRDTDQFVFRYGPAIRGYLAALLRDADAVEEVSQQLMAKLLAGGGPDRWPRRGRYRYFLKVVVRNAAVTFARARRGRQMPDGWFDRHADADAESDREWLSRWQRCVLDKAWAELDRRERASHGVWCATVLRLVGDHPDAGAKELARLFSARVGRPVTPEAFRQQVCRARRLLAAALVAEVTATIADPTPEAVQRELIDLRLWPLVGKYVEGPVEGEPRPPHA
jgi:hypothetical protein